MKKENIKEYIYFGRYPQTIVSNEELINSLNKISEINKSGFIEYEGKEYKKVVAEPFISEYFNYCDTFSNNHTIKKGEVYYFKVEPIKWRVLENNNGNYKLLSEYLLDAKYYYKDYIYDRNIDGAIILPNNYMYSNIRAYLNGFDGSKYNVNNYKGIGFYDIAFTTEEKEFINNVLEDKLCLLSYQDMFEVKYFNNNEDRYAEVTDYAKARGCYAQKDNSLGWFWLSTPCEDFSHLACYVDDEGDVFDYGFYVSDNDKCVRPVIEIKVK